MHGDLADRGRHLGHGPGDVGMEVALVEHDDRPRAAPLGHDEVAFDRPQLQRGVEAKHDEHEVDVRGDHLFLGPAARRLAGKRAVPPEEAADLAAVPGRSDAHGDPVADGRQLIPARPRGASAVPSPRPGPPRSAVSTR